MYICKYIHIFYVYIHYICIYIFTYIHTCMCVFVRKTVSSILNMFWIPLLQIEMWPQPVIDSYTDMHSWVTTWSSCFLGATINFSVDLDLELDIIYSRYKIILLLLLIFWVFSKQWRYVFLLNTNICASCGYLCFKDEEIENPQS